MLGSWHCIVQICRCTAGPRNFSSSVNTPLLNFTYCPFSGDFRELLLLMWIRPAMWMDLEIKKKYYLLLCSTVCTQKFHFKWSQLRQHEGNRRRYHTQAAAGTAAYATNRNKRAKEYSYVCGRSNRAFWIYLCLYAAGKERSRKMSMYRNDVRSKDDCWVIQRGARLLN
jgi:hypothetical protein